MNPELPSQVMPLPGGITPRFAGAAHRRILSHLPLKLPARQTVSNRTGAIHEPCQGWEDGPFFMTLVL